jgi:phosphoenolpyruvate synthase/pyruvate phosphate dikinase
MMSKYIYSLNGNIHPELSQAGGKGANLMELVRMDDINCPDGFIITTAAYAEIFKNNKELDRLISDLKHADAGNPDYISEAGSAIRDIIAKTAIPKEICDEIKTHLDKLGENKAYAVRSSATAEDLPGASFAGQHDTYLNISGYDNIIKHIGKCWASLFTDRAIVYRIQNGFDHRVVMLAVIVQEMVMPDTSGVMFTADPISSNRKIISIDACYGLGEGLVSGRVNSDNYRVRGNIITDKSIAGASKTYTKGSAPSDADDKEKTKQVLADKQILALGRLGRKIEAHFSYPQDIEWCISDDRIFILQSRPITTLYPVPDEENAEKRVYISSGHLQMMTDPIKPLGMFFFRSVIGNPPSREIGGRLYLDLSNDISTPFSRTITKYILGMLGDTLLTNAVLKLIENKKFIKELPKGKEKVFNLENNSGAMKIMLNAYKAYKENDPDLVRQLIDKEENDIKKMGEALSELSGDEALEFICRDHDNRRQKIANPRNAGVLTAVMLSIQSFDKKIKKWLGEPNAADTIIMSVPNSITTETGFALMDVSDVIRDYPEVIDYLNNPCKETFFDDIDRLDGGRRVNESLKKYLSQYGMRCSGDIDITVPRWIEDPLKLVPIIQSNIKNFESNASERKLQQGRVQSEKRIDELVQRVHELPGGAKKAKKIKRMAGLIRHYIAFREYPKFSYMKRYYLYKEAMLKEAKKLAQNGVINQAEDIYYLYFDELRALINGEEIDTGIISVRKKEYEKYARLTPVRVITSEGEVITGEYENKDIPENALPGLPVSAGIAEGRARIVKNLSESFLAEGDILVTEFTDPSWTPAFVTVKGLVTEVGGLTTHGAVIAREYGLPAVVSVKDATKLIKDGQLIRINGSEGYIEILSE